MASTDSRASLLLFLLPAVFLNIILVSASSQSIGDTGVREGSDGGRIEDEGARVLGRLLLTSFKETRSGGNVTFECSPSGPCIACLYSEKNDEKYRCSETGYRIPLKCVETATGSKDKSSKKVQKSRSTLEELTDSVHRNLLDDSSTVGVEVEGGSQDYITYRSCIPAVDEEKLSVLGFEVLLVGLLLVSGFVIFLRRKQSAAISGAVRLPTNSRF